VRFTEFLRSTVLLTAAAATLLAVVTLLRDGQQSNVLAVAIAAAWWIIAAAAGGWVGRRPETSESIARLLSAARTQASLPEVAPARILLNRLWPLLVCTLGAAAFALALPQVPAVGAGFAIIWAMSWRRQAGAVSAVEERDGARFYVQLVSPLRPIQLVRTPGFRSNLIELNGASRNPGAGLRH
jgi:hypothetical protein